MSLTSLKNKTYNRLDLNSLILRTLNSLAGLCWNPTEGRFIASRESHTATHRARQLVLHLVHRGVQLLPLQQDGVLHKKEGSVLININIHVIAIKPAHIPFQPLNVNAYFNTLSLPPS